MRSQHPNSLGCEFEVSPLPALPGADRAPESKESYRAQASLALLKALFSTRRYSLIQKMQPGVQGLTGADVREFTPSLLSLGTVSLCCRD